MSFCTCDLKLGPCKGDHDETENVDVQIESLGERIEIVGITLEVMREKLDSIDQRLALLERLC